MKSLQRTLLAILCLGSLLATSARAQSVLVVDASSGPGSDFAEVQDAVLAVPEGSILLVRPGTYSLAVELDDRELSIVADSGGAVVLPSLEVRNLGAAKRVLLRGLDTAASFFDRGLSVTDCSGVVWVEDCTLGGTPGSATPTGGMTVVNSATVVVVRSVIGGTPVVNSFDPMVDIQDSTVHMYGTTVFGTAGAANIFVGSGGGRAIGVSDSQLFVSDSTVVGGAGGAGVPLGSLCTPGGSGGSAISMTGASSRTVTQECSLMGGAGGPPSDPSCSAGGTGSQIFVSSGTLTELTSEARRMRVDGPTREQEGLDENYHGVPNDYIVIGISTDAMPSPYFDGVSGPILPTVQFNFTRGFIFPPGDKVKNLTLSELGLGIEGLILFEQAFFLDIVAGEIFASAPTAPLFLDDSF